MLTEASKKWVRGPLVVVLLGASALHREVSAWGEQGHVLITRAAAEKVPNEMPKFLRKSADLLGYLSVQPDRWKMFSFQLYEVEKPNHYVDLENLDADASKVTFPVSRLEFLRQLQERQLHVKDVGTLPHQLNEYFMRLRGGFMEYRWARQDPKGRQHRSPSRSGSLKSIEMCCLYYAGLMAHYAADATQPLHSTVFFDGRGPDGKPKRTGAHLRYEVNFVNRHITKVDDFVALVEKPELISGVIEEAQRVLVESNGLAIKVLEYDEQGKLDKDDREAVRLTKQRIAEGSQVLLNLWYTAWVRSGKDLQDYIKKFKPKK